MPNNAPAGNVVPHNDELINKWDELQGLFGNYHMQVRTNRDYYNLRFEHRIVPEEWAEALQPLVPPTARLAIDEASDHILTTPKVKVPVRSVLGKEVEQQDIAESKRKFLNSFWHTITTNGDPLNKAKKTLLIDGKVAVKKTLRWDLIPDKPENGSKAKYRRDLAKLGKIDFLWNVEVIPTEYVYEDPSNHQDPEFVYLSYKIMRGEAKRMFPDSSGDWREGSDFERIEYKEYWSKPTFLPDGSWEPGEYVQWVENTRVHDAENPYPYIPICIEDSGFGVVTPEPKPEDKFVGIAQNMHQIFEAEAVQMTSWQAVLQTTAFPMITARNIPDEKEIEVGPGVINRLEGEQGEPGAESIVLEQFPEVPVGLLQFVQKTTEIANSTMKIGVLGGQPQRGVETATEADANFRNAAVKLAGPVAALERLVKKISRWVLMDIELVLEAPVTLYGAGSGVPAEVTLLMKDIGGYYETHVELTTADKDAVNQVNARFWAEMYRVVPFLSLYTAMEKMGLEDPQEEMMRRAAEDVFLSPQFATIRIFTGAQSFGELAQLVQGLGLTGEGGTPAETPTSSAGADSASNVFGGSGTDTGALQQQLTENSLTRRDILRGDSQLR